MLSARLRNLARLTRAASGLRGKLGVMRVVLAGQRPRSADSARAVQVPMKALGGDVIGVRPGTSDLYNASWYYLDGLHLPAAELRDRDLRQICELGSNIGAALTALALRYPGARLLGVEPDPGNAAMARANTRRLGDRCRVVEAGIWDANTDLVVDTSSQHGQHGFTVRPREAGDPPSATSIHALTVDSVLDEHMPDGDIDYMHMTIEGTEPRVLGAGGRWVERTRALRVELHPYGDFEAPRCIELLERLGYEAWTDPALPDKWVHAVRR